ncbi:hypothetical protein PV325_004435 [Microctonus aethiopoides]|uniref:Uncharacterized protein n=1 Tax=Microctonus aethiopoides TaxID=144406 RepID=A0AA39FPD9_9HYME|nr:hypothetical protein PV325_004435 [Microctonus aethiopoides]KAK0173347.1 hypothetical protein PV328_006561 [Microctonus aethiopoides]
MSITSKLHQKHSGLITTQRMGAWVDHCFVDATKRILKNSCALKANWKISGRTRITRVRTRTRIRTRRRTIQDCDADIFTWTKCLTRTSKIFQVISIRTGESLLRLLLPRSLLLSLSNSMIHLTVMLDLIILAFYFLYHCYFPNIHRDLSSINNRSL